MACELGSWKMRAWQTGTAASSLVLKVQTAASSLVLKVQTPILLTVIREGRGRGVDCGAILGNCCDSQFIHFYLLKENFLFVINHLTWREED